MLFCSNKFSEITVPLQDYFAIKFMKKRALQVAEIKTPFIKIIPLDELGNKAKEYIVARVILQENGLIHFTKKMTTT